MHIPGRYKYRVENLHKDLLRYGTFLMDNQLRVQGLDVRIRLIAYEGKVWLDTMTNGELTSIVRILVKEDTEDNGTEQERESN